MPRSTRFVAAAIVVAAAFPLPAAAITGDLCAPGSDILCAGGSTNAEQAKPYNTEAKVHAPGSMAEFRTFSWCSFGWGPNYCKSGAVARGGTTGSLPGGSNEVRAVVVCRTNAGNSAPLDTCLDADRIHAGVEADEEPVSSDADSDVSAEAMYLPGPETACVAVQVDGHTSRFRCEPLP